MELICVGFANVLQIILAENASAMQRMWASTETSRQVADPTTPPQPSATTGETASAESANATQERTQKKSFQVIDIDCLDMFRSA